MFVLDSDILDLAFHGNANVLRRIGELPDEVVWISVIAVEEVMSGAIAAINTALSKRENIQKNYDFLARQFDYLKSLPVLPYTPEADLIYQTFPSATARGRKRDCRLAAIALSKGYTVVTRNIRHFEDLARVENWAD